MERVRRGPWGFLHVARGDYCDRVEGWYSRMRQNQLRLVAAIVVLQNVLQGPGSLGGGAYSVVAFEGKNSVSGS